MATVEERLAKLEKELEAIKTRIPPDSQSSVRQGKALEKCRHR